MGGTLGEESWEGHWGRSHGRDTGGGVMGGALAESVPALEARASRAISSSDGGDGGNAQRFGTRAGLQGGG